MHVVKCYGNIIMKAFLNKGDNNMKDRFSIKIMLLIFTMSLLLAACGDELSESDEAASDDDIAEAENGSDENELFDYEDFPQTVSNTGDPTGEGTLEVGYSSSTPF